MTWPSTKARYASKKGCTKCGATFKQGDTIYKINEDYWCANQHCPKQAEGSRKEVESSGTQEKPAESRGGDPVGEYYKNTKIPIVHVDFHRDVWGFAVQEATEVFPVEHLKVPNSDKIRDTNLKDRTILAEIYYKAIMGMRE